MTDTVGTGLVIGAFILGSYIKSGADLIAEAIKVSRKRGDL